MALVGNILLGTGAAPGISSIASAYAESAASSRIPWGALEYSGQTITAISGSAIGGQGGGGGGVTPEEVSAIASAYADDKLDKTASSTFAPSGDYAYASSLSSYLPGSASSNFAPSGDYAYNSSLSGKLDNSAISSQSAVWNTVTGKVNASDISAQSATWNTVSAKVDQSAISSWSSVFVYKSAVSGWSSQIATLSSTLSSLSATVTSMTANKYTLSAGNGISITNDSTNKRTIIATV